MLTWIANFLEEYGCNIIQVGLPQLPNHIYEIIQIQEQFNNYDILISKKEKMINKLNAEQKDIYNKIMYHIYNNKPLIVFINRYAGHGKTFLINTICTMVRSLKKIILPCATTSLATLNYIGDRTAHSLFRILVEYNDDRCKCQINPESERAELIRESSAITWDKLPIAQKSNIEAVDILIHNLCKYNLLFGGKIFIDVGDFHQVASVISNSSQIATILESIKSSSLWSKFEIFNLQILIQDSYDIEYSKLIDDIGDEVNKINDIILQQLKGNETNLYSTDDLANDKIQENNTNQRNMPTTELLNSFNALKIPQHCLTLKCSCVATIMRNLSLQDGLCKNSRVIIINIGYQLITVKNPKTNCIAYLS
ncbi:3924_t:CDS:2 [Scutellospora calospora]|uniref:3924_t:CDS:1 n=1 Tax=Scutellospora calospora TaxID=85575 RepID=A0ACA9K6F2_9GLOM|nr:3924_t:CDS:2 [Scutellospora calospora]